MSAQNSFGHSIVVVGDAQTCTGFRLAGIKNAFAVENNQAQKKLEEIIEDQSVGIVIVNEELLLKLDWRLKKKLERIAKPVIIGVPDKHGPREEAESLKSMISKALGVNL